MDGVQKEYIYKRLEENEIRILHLQPGERSDSVFIEISHEKLDTRVGKYHALSWQWGREKANKVIRIKHKHEDNTNPEIWTMKIMPNLLAALKHLRMKDKILRLWVDAICIEQIEQGDNSRTSTNSDEQKNLEKSNQISIMTDIYGMAENVCVWLGEEREEGAKAIELVNRLVELKDFDHIRGLESIGNDLGALIKLLKRGWFSRRWVVQVIFTVSPALALSLNTKQEIALAQDATVHCGSKTVSWTKVADAIALLEKVGRDGTINRILKKRPETNHVPEYIGNISSMPAYRLVQNTAGLFRGKGERGFKTWRYTLEELVSFLAAFNASRLHDTIYAILGLASDVTPVHASKSKSEVTNTEPGQSLRKVKTQDWSRTTEENFEVDYEKPVLAVFKKFLNHAIMKSNSLDMICRPWAPDSGFDAKGNKETIRLPSWIPNLLRKPFQLTRNGNMVRYNPDPLVGPAIFRHKLYSASGSVNMLCKIDLENPYSERMTVEGFVLDKIGEIWDSGEFGNVPTDWLKAGHWEDDNKVPPDELWRTLVADRNAEGYDPDRWYPLVFQSAVKERGISYGFETYRLIHESASAKVTELFRRVQAVVWNRRLIRTGSQFMPWLTKRHDRKSPGVLGLAPNDARKDDLICIIFGCSVPLVLRRIPLPKQPTSPQPETGANQQGIDPLDATSSPPSVAPSLDEELYTLVGECYVDHMMDGEAIAYFRDEKLDCKNFILE
jgi:hypothetical protein